MKKKPVLHSEIVYIVATITMALSVALLTTADFGVSMITGIPYILSLKFPVMTLGMYEYVFQTIMLVVLCIVTKKFRVLYLSAYISSILYSVFLDLIRWLVPFLNPNITAPGSPAMYVRIIMFVTGMVFTSLSVAIYFKVYLYPQIYDFFPKKLCQHFNWNLIKVKRIYDATLFTGSVALSLILFHGFRGIGIGTIIITLVNSVLIGLFSRVIDKHIVLKPIFPKLESKF